MPPNVRPIGAACPLCALRRIAQAVRLWVTFASAHSRLTPAYLRKKARDVRRFSATLTASGSSPLGVLSVPSKLVGVLRHQDKLAALKKALSASSDPFSIRLDLRVEMEARRSQPRLVVRHGGDPIGEVQPRHVPWLLPLVGHGLTVHVLDVTGGGTRTLGLNVAFGHVAESLRLAEAEEEAERHETKQQDSGRGGWPLAA